MSSCETNAAEFAVTTKSVAPVSEITWVGQATKLEGQGRLALGSAFPSVLLTNLKMEPARLEPNGHVLIIDVIPSIDTPVCNEQTHLLSATKSLSPAVDRITISRDLPYALRRFAETEKIAQVQFYSDYRSGEFGKLAGLEIARNGLLARAVIVVDQDGVVRHLQVVPEITDLPDMAKAFDVANRLAAGQKTSASPQG